MKNPTSIPERIRFRDEVLGAVSPSFCAAKWLNATIWLHNGTTASCHHPNPHRIDPNQIRRNPAALHNTEQKKEARAQMLQGIRPPECEYCWRIEDLGANHLSDRVFKSEIYSKEILQQIATQAPSLDVLPRTLEVAFDRTCNFACSYCSAAFSTTWAQDIQRSGPYRNLGTDRFQHYVSAHSGLDSENGTSPYLDAFWRWWPELKKVLQELRITGGEPLASPHLWRLLDDLAEQSDRSFPLAINSNLGLPEARIREFAKRAQRIGQVEIYTSNESVGSHAEYIRDGLDWQLWVRNAEYLLREGGIRILNIMATVGALSIYGLVDFLDFVVDLKQRSPTPVGFSINILRYPVFHSLMALPAGERERFADAIQGWMAQPEKMAHVVEFESASLLRLVDYLRRAEPLTGHETRPGALAQDLRLFVDQYDRRRGKDFRRQLKPDAARWIESLGGARGLETAP